VDSWSLKMSQVIKKCLKILKLNERIKIFRFLKMVSNEKPDLKFFKSFEKMRRWMIIENCFK
jgi:hypothetical protein